MNKQEEKRIRSKILKAVNIGLINAQNNQKVKIDYIIADEIFNELYVRKS